MIADFAEDRALRVGAALPADVALLLCRILCWHRRRFGNENGLFAFRFRLKIILFALRFQMELVVFLPGN